MVRKPQAARQARGGLLHCAWHEPERRAPPRPVSGIDSQLAETVLGAPRFTVAATARQPWRLGLPIMVPPGRRVDVAAGRYCSIGGALWLPTPWPEAAPLRWP